MTFSNNYLNLKDYYQLSIRHYFREPRRVYMVISALILIPLFWCIVWVKEGFLQGIINHLFMAGMTLLLASLPILARYYIKNIYSNTRFLQNSANLTFTEEGLLLESQTIEAQISWNTFLSFSDLGSHGMLLTNASSGFCLDFATLQPPYNKADFLTLLQTHNLKIK